MNLKNYFELKKTFTVLLVLYELCIMFCAMFEKKSHLKFSLMLPLNYTWWVLDWSRRRFLIRIGPGVLFKDWYPGPGVLLRDGEPFIKLGLTLVSILSSSLHTGFSLISILLFIVEFLMSSDKGELSIFSSILDLCSLRLDFSSVLKY